MPLPSAVRKNAQAADDFIKGNIGEKLPTPSEEPNKNTETPAIVVDKDPTNIPASVQQPQHEDKPVDELTGLKKLLDESEQRNRVLQGKYTAEVPRMAEELRRARAENAAMQSEIQNLQSSINNPTNTASSQDDELIRSMAGDDLGELIIGLRQEVSGLKSANSLMKDQLSKTSSEFNRTVQMSNKAKLAEALSASDLNLEAMNSDDSFNDWLDGYDEMSGVQRRRLMNDAYKAGEIERAARFFLMFGKGNHSVGSVHDQKPKQQNAPQPNLSVESTATTNNMAQGNDAVLPHEIANFYSREVQRKLTDEEKRIGEQRIFAGKRPF